MEQLDPKKTLDTKRFMEYEESVKDSKIIDYTLSLINKKNMKILDVGGASGVFLNEIMVKSRYPIKAFNLEISDYYKDRLVNKNIKFIRSSIIDNKIKDNTFDIVVFRHILHHLVSDSIKNTLNNQEKALYEMFRIVKKGGHVVFEEEVNEIQFFSKIIYLLSKIANKLKIRLKYFETGKVVVLFNSSEGIKKIIDALHKKVDISILKKDYIPWNLKLKWKLTLLMSKVGSVCYLIKVNK